MPLYIDNSSIPLVDNFSQCNDVIHQICLAYEQTTLIFNIEYESPARMNMLQLYNRNNKKEYSYDDNKYIKFSDHLVQP